MTIDPSDLASVDGERPETGGSGRARLDATRLDAAFAVVARQVADGQVPSAVLAVADAEGIIQVDAWSGRDQTTIEAIYLLASITKPIVATAIMQLVEHGQLVLSTPIKRFLPEFEPSSGSLDATGHEPITAQHLLTHTSGMIDIDEDLLSRERPDRARLFEIACTAPLRFASGTRYEYDSLTFVVLGELIRRLDGRDYPAYLRDEIFGPLGMRDTAFKAGDRARAVRASFPGFPAAYQDMVATYFDSMEAPGGGLWATVADVAAFGRAMLRGGELDGQRVLGRPFVELMTRQHTADVHEAGTPGRSPGYGLGWGLPVLAGSMPGSPRTFGHGGGTGTRLWIDPDAGLVIVYLTNDWTVGDTPSLAAIAAVYGALDR